MTPFSEFSISCIFLLLLYVDKQEARGKIVLLCCPALLMTIIYWYIYKKRKKKAPYLRSVTMHSSTSVQYFASMHWSKL
jgi:hypothetical protein